MILWPSRVWEHCLDAEGRHNGFWFSRPVTAEDRKRRQEAELESELFRSMKSGGRRPTMSIQAPRQSESAVRAGMNIETGRKPEESGLDSFSALKRFVLIKQ